MADIARVLRVTVDLDSGLVPRPQIPVLMQGDKQADKVIVSVIRDGQPVDLSGVSASGSFIRSSGDGVPVTGTVAGNEATIMLNDHCYAETGPYELQVRLQIGGERRTVLLITGRVHQKGSGRIIDVEHVIPSLDDILAQLDVMRAATAATEAATKAAGDAAASATAATEGARSAETSANAAAGSASAEAEKAKAAAEAANKAAKKIDGMQTGAQSLPPESDPTAEITDDGERLLLALGIPAGRTGPTGLTPRISAEIETGAAGSDAQISVTGTPEDPIIHFLIPRGDTGDIGNLTINGKSPDGAGRVMLDAADIGAYPSGGIRTAHLSVEESSWAGSGPYTLTLARADVTDKTWLDIRLDATSMARQTAAIQWETGTGQITLATSSKPTGTIDGTMMMMEVGA